MSVRLLHHVCVLFVSFCVVCLCIRCVVVVQELCTFCKQMLCVCDFLCFCETLCDLFVAVLVTCCDVFVTLFCLFW